MVSLDDLTADQLAATGIDAERAEQLQTALSSLKLTGDVTRDWPAVTQSVVRPNDPITLHRLLHDTAFADWDAASLGPPPAWFPDENEQTSNLSWLMRETGHGDFQSLHTWSVRERESFWKTMIERLGVVFEQPAERVLITNASPEDACWLEGAQLNIVASCLQAADDSIAILERDESGEQRTFTIDQLSRLVGRVANSLLEQGIKPNDCVALDMPMRAEAVAIYLGAVAIGASVVTIADSFAANEIAIRLEIAKPVLIFTQDVLERGTKKLPLYERVIEAAAPTAVVISCGERQAVELRAGDYDWNTFLSSNESIPFRTGSPDTVTTVLFSSGTTGTPKAIPWDQTTPIKASMDGHLHQDIRPGDTVCWPTNMGWMMGPWLVFASLMNRATIALFNGAPGTRNFCQFVADCRVTMLGLVPSLVSAWRAGDCLDGLDWTGIRAFSTTGECSNPNDMFYLMVKAGYRPIIEYCGGTEIGGGYIAGSVVQPAAPSTFTTPAMGLDLVLLDEANQPANVGEVFLIPPSIGLSQRLLNGDHHQVYYAGTPQTEAASTLRRHGDRLQRLPGGGYRALGRADDSMNLGGVKVSSLEIEEVVNRVDSVRESAAIAVPPPDGGPAALVIYAVLHANAVSEPTTLRGEMQAEIRSRLNPLFKLQEVVIVDSLPRTASNKVMRRLLRDRHLGSKA